MTVRAMWTMMKLLMRITEWLGHQLTRRHTVYRQPWVWRNRMWWMLIRGIILDTDLLTGNRSRSSSDTVETVAFIASVGITGMVYEFCGSGSDWIGAIIR